MQQHSWQNSMIFTSPYSPLPLKRLNVDKINSAKCQGTGILLRNGRKKQKYLMTMPQLRPFWASFYLWFDAEKWEQLHVLVGSLCKQTGGIIYQSKPVNSHSLDGHPAGIRFHTLPTGTSFSCILASLLHDIIPASQQTTILKYESWCTCTLSCNRNSHFHSSITYDNDVKKDKKILRDLCI